MMMMTQPANFSTVPQQPMYPYNNQKPVQPPQQQTPTTTQFGTVPAEFTAQSANRSVRTGRTPQERADEIQLLQNYPLPTGGNPLLAGAITLGATAAVTTGVSESTYRWGNGGLASKLNHVDNGKKMATATLTDPDKKQITTDAQTAKLQQLQADADIAYHQTHQKTIETIIPNASSVEAAIADQTANVQALEAAKQAELTNLQSNRRASLQAIVEPNHTGQLNETELTAKVQVLNGNLTPAGYSEWQADVKAAKMNLESANANLKDTEITYNKAQRNLNNTKQAVATQTMEALEKEAFGTKKRGLWGGEFFELKESATLQRAGWIDNARAFHNDQSVDFGGGQDSQQKYIQFLEEKINEKTFREQKRIKGYEAFTPEQQASYDAWKQKPGNVKPPVYLDEVIAKNKVVLFEEQILQSTESNRTKAQAKKASYETAYNDLTDGTQYADHLNYEVNQNKQVAVAELEAKHTTAVQSAEASHTAAVADAKAKLQQLETIRQNKPTINTNDTDVKAKIDAEVKQQLITAEEDLPKTPIAVDPMEIKDAEGFGKAWQNVDELKAKGFTELAEHSTNAKWAGIKAGALTAVIGAGLTVHQLMEAGKAQDVSNARQARLDQLRKEQQLGG